MNDLPDILQFCHVTLYVDDIALYFATTFFSDIEKTINADLQHMYQLIDQLTLNVKKTIFFPLVSSCHLLSNVGSI